MASRYLKSRSRKIIKVAIDSQLLTYFIEAINPSYDHIKAIKDKPKIAQQRFAILRIFLCTKHLYIMPTVQEEYGKIKIEELKKKHKDIHERLLLDCPHLTDQNITFDNEKKYYLKFHDGEKDCQIIAEAEGCRMDYFLTFDGKLYERLHNNTKVVKIMKTDEFWLDVSAVPKGSEPKLAPHCTNPLYKKDWWKW